MLTVPGVQDIRNSQLSQVPQLNIQLDSQRMAELGISNQTVDNALSTAIGGSVVTELQPPGTQQEDITLEGSDSTRYNLTTLGQLPVGSANGAPVTLGQVATFTNGSGPVTIQRVNRADTVTLSASAVGRPLGDVATDMNHALQTLNVPAGYSYALRGSVQIFNQVPGGLAHYKPLVPTMNANVDNYAAVDSMPSMGLFAWFFIVPGTLIVLFDAYLLVGDYRPRWVWPHMEDRATPTPAH